ncbi:sigma-70 family RNA polymerase sigma factor [Chitinophaga horti]|uniref:Sigma-70 family RNA polymerase sigma factor n=1 Tax=Chitinophaga horti TaxID=2920382 RepID=A0ABY6IWP4_9BACT|nr:sigma-70 family RNA polymerase sigma factor [Chitinophaga horti]UYQ91791.1 sigma-70 family RNA polymerase sigma factor [Chitinophaga horti]
MEDVRAAIQQFDVLYQEYHQAVYANISKMIRQPEAAEDILQEVFMALWEHYQQLDADRVPGWLFVVSYNKSANWLKNKLKQPALVLQEAADHLQAPEDAQEDEALYQLKLSIVEEAVSRLPKRKKKYFAFAVSKAARTTKLPPC